MIEVLAGSNQHPITWFDWETLCQLPPNYRLEDVEPLFQDLATKQSSFSVHAQAPAHQVHHIK